MNHDTAESYRVFTRTWWRYSSDPKWQHGGDLNGLEPCYGRQTTIGHHLTYDEARDLCRIWNANHKPGRLSRKAEFTRE